MIKLEKTNKYTQVSHEDEDEMIYGAPHWFETESVDEDGSTFTLYSHFQEGAIKEVGINGYMNEDLLLMIAVRLEHFQKGEFACEENQKALDCVNEALEHLMARTLRRESEGVEGTHEPDAKYNLVDMNGVLF